MGLTVYVSRSTFINSPVSLWHFTLTVVSHSGGGEMWKADMGCLLRDLCITARSLDNAPSVVNLLIDHLPNREWLLLALSSVNYCVQTELAR